MENSINNEETIESNNTEDLIAEASSSGKTAMDSPAETNESSECEAKVATPNVADSPEDKKSFWTFPNIMRLLAAAAAIIVIIFTLLGRMSDELGTRMLEFGLICFAIAFFSRKKD